MRAGGALERVGNPLAESSPALIRCGWGWERNRNGGNAAMAIPSPPAWRKRARGGGY